MIQEPPSKAWIGCVSAAAVIIAAIIGLGMPFAERLADRYFPPPTSTSSSITPSLPTQPIINVTASVKTDSLVNHLFLGADVSLAPLVSDITQNSSQMSQTQLENAVRRIQAEADRLHSGRFESNSIDIPKDNWWLVWCSNVPSIYYSGLPTGWDYLFGQPLPTFGQLYVVSPTAESRRLDSCNSPKGWWGVVVYLDNP